MKPAPDRLVDAYLKRLDAELRGLPRARRREIADDIAGHIAEARADLEAESEAAVRDLLDRLGDPADIAAEARGRFGLRPRRRIVGEIFALILLPIGGVILPVLGWFIGVVLLWVSDAWTTREKLVGTFVIPGGLLAPLLLGGLAVNAGTCRTEFDAQTGEVFSQDCTGAAFKSIDVLGPVAAVVLLLAPIFTVIFLARRLRRNLDAAYQPSPGSV